MQFLVSKDRERKGDRDRPAERKQDRYNLHISNSQKVKDAIVNSGRT